MRQGTLLEYGSAPYNFDEKEEKNYFVRYLQNNQERIVWGVGLEDAIEQSEAMIGDKITIEHLGQEQVTIQVPILDDDGEPTGGFSAKDVNRNKWEILTIERHQNIEIDVDNEDFISDEQTKKAKKAIVQQAQTQQEHIEQNAQAQSVEKEKKDTTQNNKSSTKSTAIDEALVLNKTGGELEKNDFVMPRQIAKSYVEVDGKFYSKESNVRVMFEDRGEKITTSTTDQKAIEDMVIYAKAKQWKQLKLTGSKEFRKEAWLQAESQGIQTQGYTPKQEDIVELELLRQKRSVNTIAPINPADLANQEKPTAQQEKPNQETSAEQKTKTTEPAERHALDKNQAVLHARALENIAKNIADLDKNPDFRSRDVKEITGLAYWRGIVAEHSKGSESAIAAFDKKAVDPSFLKQMNERTKVSIDEKTIKEAAKSREATQPQPEHSL